MDLGQARRLYRKHAILEEWVPRIDSQLEKKVSALESSAHFRWLRSETEDHYFVGKTLADHYVDQGFVFNLKTGMMFVLLLYLAGFNIIKDW